MKTLALISASALLALSAATFAQSTNGATGNQMQQNGSPNGPGMSHEKQGGAADTQSGKSSGMSEGRAAAPDASLNGRNEDATTTVRGDKNKQDMPK